MPESQLLKAQSACELCLNLALLSPQPQTSLCPETKQKRERETKKKDRETLDQKKNVSLGCLLLWLKKKGRNELLQRKVVIERTALTNPSSSLPPSLPPSWTLAHAHPLSSRSQLVRVTLLAQTLWEDKAGSLQSNVHLPNPLKPSARQHKTWGRKKGRAKKCQRKRSECPCERCLFFGHRGLKVKGSEEVLSLCWGSTLSSWYSPGVSCVRWIRTTVDR